MKSTRFSFGFSFGTIERAKAELWKMLMLWMGCGLMLLHVDLNSENWWKTLWKSVSHWPSCCLFIYATALNTIQRYTSTWCSETREKYRRCIEGKVFNIFKYLNIFLSFVFFFGFSLTTRKEFKTEISIFCRKTLVGSRCRVISHWSGKHIKFPFDEITSNNFHVTRNLTRDRRFWRNKIQTKSYSNDTSGCFVSTWEA